jgi:hypothetical protein
MNAEHGCDHPYFVLGPAAEAERGLAIRAVACGVCERVVGSIQADIAELIAERHSTTAPEHVPARRRRFNSLAPRRRLRTRDGC